MTKLRLQPSDPEVIDLTCRVVEASEIATAQLVGLCAKCQPKSRVELAKVGYTGGHALFKSSWRVPLDAGISINGERVNQRQYEIFEKRLGFATSVTGHIDRNADHTVFALLALPLELRADYPDLLVRCERHGDAVLDRLEALDRLRVAASGGDPLWKIDVNFPRLEYEPPDPTWLLSARSARRITQRRTAHYGDGDIPNEQRTTN